MRVPNRNTKWTERKRFDWFIERTQTYLAFVQLSPGTFQKLIDPSLDVILLHGWPIKQFLLHIRVFFGGKTSSPCFDLSLHPLADKANNEHLRNYYSRSYENCSNSSTSRGDQSLTSPCSDTAQTIIKVERIKEMINKCKSSGQFNRFSSLVPWEVYGEKCGEYPW